MPSENDFGWALARLREWKQVRRRGWNGKGMWLTLQMPDVNSKMTLPYLFIKTVQDDFVPWTASQADLLSTDWELDE